MDSNSKHCPSRSSTDNLGKQPSCGDEKKEPNGLPTSCATSSATEDRTPSPVSETGSNLQQSNSFGVNEMVASVTEGSVVGMRGQEDCLPSTSQIADRSNGATSSDLTITFGGSNPRVVTIPPETCLLHTTVPSPQLSASDPEKLSDDTELPALIQCEATPRGIKRSHEEVVKEEAGSPCAVKQKNKKRCFKCTCKLELAQREIGRCRCDRVFCSVHRLPEQHGCDFDHKEEGRREAREKIVKPTRHLGNSFRRLDSRS